MNESINRDSSHLNFPLFALLCNGVVRFALSALDLAVNYINYLSSFILLVME